LALSKDYRQTSGDIWESVSEGCCILSKRTDELRNGFDLFVTLTTSMREGQGEGEIWREAKRGEIVYEILVER
jgi:Ni,Fe-hydrogenase III large subunit